MKDNNENKIQKNDEQQEQTPKKESFLKRTWKRFGRDCLDIGIGLGIGGFVTYEVLKARSGNAVEETVPEEEQETEEENVLEVSDE